MDVTPLIPADRQVIDSYGPGIFRVSGTLYEGPLLVFPDRTPDRSIRDGDTIAVAGVLSQDVTGRRWGSHRLGGVAAFTIEET